MAYQPFLIAPFGTGLDTDLEPWLLPQDAFSEIVNGHVHHGITEKREGYTKLGDIVYQEQTNWKITGVTQANPGVVTLTDVTGLTNGDTVEIRNVVGMTELNGNRYTVANLAGGAGGTFELSGVDTTNFTAYGSGGDVLEIPGTRVMGLENYIDSSNVKELIAFDRFRACKYNTGSFQFDPLDSDDILSGSDSQYIWAANWASTSGTAAAPLYRLYFTNGKAYSAGPPVVDGIRFYNGGTTTTSFRPQINGATFINGCRLLFAYRNRLVLLNTIEGATTFPQRARWCQSGSPGTPGAFTTEWDDNVAGRGGFVDAPTGDQIISAQFVQDQLIVFFTNSVWALVPTGDPALVFTWRKINDFRACDGKMTTEQFDRYAIAAGIRGLTATDGVESRRFDERIEDFVDDQINNAEFEKVFTKRSFGKRRVWMLYPSVESDEANSALIYDEESGAFSKYDIDMNVVGYNGAAADAAIDDFGDQTIDQFADDTLQDYIWDQGSETLIGGDRGGEIWTLEVGGDDNEKRFQADIINVTQANPGVVTMTGDVGLSDGDTITISDVVGMTEINNREFIVASKSGNSFALSGEDTTGHTAYTSGGVVRTVQSDTIVFDLMSAAWNPWMQEGKQAQMGYVDFFLDTHISTTMDVSFFVNNEQTPYATRTINLLPNVVERSNISNITNTNPAVITANEHGLSDNDEVYLYNVEGMDAINGVGLIITVVDQNTFSAAIDSTNFGLYTNGGVVAELPFSSEKAWKRVYAGGSGYQHKIEITSEGADRPLRIHAYMPWFKPRSVRPI